MKTFIAGKTYATRSIGDHNCVFSMTVISRTEKTIKADVKGFGVKTLRVSTRYTADEQVAPLGNYSMAPRISADQIQ